MNEKIIQSFTLLVIITFTFTQLAYSKPQAIVLSDAELDNISAAGFDIDINAAYAFRAAVINQSNIAGITSINSNSKININASNQAQVLNNNGPTITNQNNLSAIIAKVGDIKNALIQNINTLLIKNDGVAPEPLQTPAPVDTLAPPQASALVITTNAIAVDASSLTTQTNIAAVVALEGSIENANINNSNSAVIEEAGNLAVADQTNITIVMAKGNIDAIINNANIADFADTKTTHTAVGVASVLAGNDVLTKFDVTKICVNGNTQSVQRNITFIKSLNGNDNDFTRKLTHDLNFRRMPNWF